MKSVLRHVTRADVIADPFPHVVVDDALEDELYRELMASFPPVDAIVNGRALENNTTYHLPIRRLLDDQRVDDRWRDFARLHTSRAFFREVTHVFGDAIHALYPRLQLDAMRTNMRGAEPFADVALDCQPAWGSPVTHASTSNACHVDREVALFAGLLYCRLPDDDGAGGDLELFRFIGDDRVYDANRFVDASLVEPVKRIPYAANRLVFFIQSPESLHGVTTRAVTQWPRLHVNFLGELQEKVFDLGVPAYVRAM
jgi:hypothetical protein